MLACVAGPVFELHLACHGGLRPGNHTTHATRWIAMKQTIPGAIGFHVIEHDWAVWSSIAHLAFGKLTLHAPPNVCPTLSLQKLPAIDRGVVEDMFDNMTRIALKHIGVLRIHGDDTFGALSVTASPSCKSPMPRS